MVGTLDARNELRDVVVLGDARRGDLLAVAIETAVKRTLASSSLAG
jgi:hypothetical protein